MYLKNRVRLRVENLEARELPSAGLPNLVGPELA